MILLSVLSTLPLLGGTPTPAPDNAAAPPPESVLRRYDLNAVSRETGGGKGYFALMPASVKFRGPTDFEQDQSFHSEELVELLDQLFREEFEYEGRMMLHTEGNELLVKAPREVHEGIREVLGFVSEATNSRTELLVDLIQLPTEAAAQIKTLGLVELAEAERLLDSTARGSQRESHVVSLRPGEMAELDATTRHQLLAAYYVEVAQSSFAYDPYILTMLSGTRLSVRGAPTPGGTRLSLVLTHGTPNGPVQEVNLRHRALVTSESGHEYMDAPHKLQKLEIAGRTYALNTSLAHGKALVLKSVLELAGEEDSQGAQFVVIRHRNAAPKLVHESTLGRGGVKLSLIPSDALAPMQLGINTWFMANREHRLGMGSLFLPEDTDECMLWAEALWGSNDEAIEFLTSVTPDLSVEFCSDHWFLLRSGGESREQRQNASPDLEDLVEAFAPAPEVVSVRIELERLGAGASRGVSACIPVSVGVASALVLGVEGTSIPDYDVEIAQGAAVADPLTYLQIDGLAITLEPRRDARGVLTIRARGAAHLLREHVTFDPDSPMHAHLDQPLFDHLVFDETLEVGSTGGQGEGLSIGGGQNGLQLEISVR